MGPLITLFLTSGSGDICPWFQSQGGFLLPYFSFLLFHAVFGMKMFKITRMHSNRMCTAHWLTISHSIPCVSGKGLHNPPSRPPSRGGRLPCDACWEANAPMWTEGMTHSCENINLTLFEGGNKFASPILVNPGSAIALRTL